MGFYGGPKNSLRAYLLLESLVALWVFSLVTALLVGAIQQSRKREAALLHREQQLQKGHMTLQAGLGEWADVQVERGERVWTVREGEEILVQVHVLSP